MSGFLDLNRSDSIGCQVGFKEIYIGQKKRLIVSVNVFGSVRKRTEKHYLGSWHATVAPPRLMHDI